MVMSYYLEKVCEVSVFFLVKNWLFRYTCFHLFHLIEEVPVGMQWGGFLLFG